MINIVGNEKAVAFRLNELAREQMKMKIMNDILIDITICQIEEWEYLPYLAELRDMIIGLIPSKKPLLD